MIEKDYTMRDLKKDFTHVKLRCDSWYDWAGIPSFTVGSYTISYYRWEDPTEDSKMVFVKIEFTSWDRVTTEDICPWYLYMAIMYLSIIDSHLGREDIGYYFQSEQRIFTEKWAEKAIEHLGDISIPHEWDTSMLARLQTYLRKQGGDGEYLADLIQEDIYLRESLEEIMGTSDDVVGEPDGKKGSIESARGSMSEVVPNNPKPPAPLNVRIPMW